MEINSELQNGGTRRSCCQQHNTTKILLLLASIFVLFTITPRVYAYLFLTPTFVWSSSTSSSSSPTLTTSTSTSTSPFLDAFDEVARVPKKCDIFRGEWVPNPDAPYYNETCWAIHNHQNCLKYGRPDHGFMKWRWKPNQCDLPIFDPGEFLEIVRGKSLAFVGDSVGRNQMQALICVLLRVTYAVDSSLTTDHKSRRYYFPTHNFTVANFWSPYLVKTEEADPNGPTNTGLFNLQLDKPDKFWTSQVEEFDYVIVSACHWFSHPTIFYLNNELVGCHYCLKPNVTDMTMYYSYRIAFRTTFQFFNSLNNFKGTLFLRTYSPSHYENGEWNNGGNCIRTKPFSSNETRMEGINLKMYTTQLEEYKAAESEGSKKGIKYRLLDTTNAMWLRPDGHPTIYGHRADERVTLYNDCVHWCLPGPIDTWNDFLLHMLKTEG